MVGASRHGLSRGIVSRRGRPAWGGGCPQMGRMTQMGGQARLGRWAQMRRRVDAWGYGTRFKPGDSQPAGQARLGRGLSTDGPDDTDGRAGPLGEMGTDEEEG
jgi:hypothetical protein